MKIIDVVAAILEQNGRILLAQRGAGSDQAGLWEFPGGKVEAGESQPEALARELDEELGICARIGNYVGSNQWQQGERLIRLHAWQVAEFSGELQQRCHSALVWVTPQQAQEYALAPADVPLLAEYIAAQGDSRSTRR
ncbi:TPA: pyrimidine (deoxy)nucleoside triphosphate diphosphatase [Serratia marcescens]|nr:pyrimidine (deoxy)nucleoside triphosphate diphosphatase [Serratia marcescens]HEJ8102056.1 pyrimidine (deoxy)nucleoside triphosphate diphosphatase [Serratia marcescens]